MPESHEARSHEAQSHEAHVVAQFGPRAQAYVESADHARGADLARIAALAAEQRPARVLDLGCGGGHVSFTIAPHAGEVVACDLSAEMLRAVTVAAEARGLANIRTRQGSAEALPFETGAFDMVATRFSAHHWRDLAAAGAEMRRVLAPGGLVLVADTVSPGDPLADTFLQAIEVLRDPSHVRNRSLAEWAAILGGAGLSVAQVTQSRLRLEFAGWIARIGTPAPMAVAIRLLQNEMPPDVARHFGLEADGSFTIDTALIEARAA